jgi:hypothetical protein
MDKIITINVGGVLYTTTTATLRNAPGHSMLAATAAFLAADPPQMQPGALDADGYLFIDRDGPLFAYILRFLRNGGRVALPDDASTCYAIELEAEFFGLADLVSLAKQHATDLDEEDSKKHTEMEQALARIADSQENLLNSQATIVGNLENLVATMQTSYEVMSEVLTPIKDLADGLVRTSYDRLERERGPTLLRLLYDISQR